MVMLYIDNSKSKSGKHAIRSLLFEVKDSKIIEVKMEGRQVKSIYKLGEARVVEVNKGTFIYLRLIKNIYNKISGKIIVIKDNNIVLELNYRKLKIKRVNGDQSFYDKVKSVLDSLKIPVKKVNLK
ncbi:hypothetical protein DFR86_09495 [Acidianus sulfidivorans JP7]|uniref:Uncharacterized protein n=1 Tax=Acidianus sulfidivorans JP7 TaxID=619593 RepID=A0A2U9IP44_9CREN|nr:hypothetical protein [Acidianus sulfidivorans]AWR97756.1 hypothetical protein DFR86_09495 [Acidianus sulfidivorans JP7]